jgi:hypothetical protein
VIDRELLQLSATSKKSTSNAARYVHTHNKLRLALRENHPEEENCYSST